jgi:hypothetical protein
LVLEEEQKEIGAEFLTKEREGALVAKVGVLTGKEQEVWRVAEDNSMDTMREIIEKMQNCCQNYQDYFWGF